VGHLSGAGGGGHDMTPRPPPPPMSAAQLTALKGNHAEAEGCNLKNSDGPEKGVVFVSDPAAEALFVDAAAYRRAQTQRTAMPSVPGAGNTWVRLLVEKSTALRTGSVFGDGFIKRMGMAGEGKRDTSVIIIKARLPPHAPACRMPAPGWRWMLTRANLFLSSQNHYPILGEDMKDAGRVFWLVRHPLSNIISQAKWHITGSHTKVVTQQEFDNYLTLGTFRYHLKMWRDHTKEWIGRTDRVPTLVVRMEDFKVDCGHALGRVMDWFGIRQRTERIDCACQKDHRAKRAANFSHAFTPAMLAEANKQASELMARLGYDIDQSELKAVPEFDLPQLAFPKRRLASALAADVDIGFAAAVQSSADDAPSPGGQGAPSGDQVLDRPEWWDD